MTRIFSTVVAITATTLLSSAAFANCNTTYCTSNSQGSTLAPLSSLSSSASYGSTSYSSAPSSYSYESAPSYSSSSYSSSSYASSDLPMYDTSYSYGVSNSYGGTLSSSTADAVYGSGSISSAYAGSDVEMYGFSGSSASVPGLGAGESLQSTNCPVNVYNPGGGRVLGCYNVVKPVPQTTYYQVVRPVVYVRYPVPVAVPYMSGCTVVTHVSRYGKQKGYKGGKFGRRCG